MRPYVRIQPYLDGLGWEAAIALAYDETTTRPEHPAHFLEDLQRLVEIIDAHHARDDIEGIVWEWELGIFVQVLNDIL